MFISFDGEEMYDSLGVVMKDVRFLLKCWIKMWWDCLKI